MKVYPEIEKLKSVAPHSQKIGEFLEWLEAEKGIRLRTDDDGPVYTSYENLIAEFFEIDLRQVERERQEILGRLCD